MEFGIYLLNVAKTRKSVVQGEAQGVLPKS